jgi:hypothetical protein
VVTRDNAIAIDPSVRCTGRARFRGGALIEVSIHLARNLPEAVAIPALHGPAVSSYPYVIEFPRAYSATRSKADPNDLLAVAAVAGAWAARGAAAGPVRFVAPSEWKGQTPKAVCAARVRAALEPAERATLDAALAEMTTHLHHNALDAVGIGLFHFGRM